MAELGEGELSGTWGSGRWSPFLWLKAGKADLTRTTEKSDECGEWGCVRGTCVCKSVICAARLK